MNDDTKQCLAQNFLNDLNAYIKCDVEVYYKSEKLLKQKKTFNNSDAVYGFTDFSILLIIDAEPLVFSPDELQDIFDLLERVGEKKHSVIELFQVFIK